MNAKELILAKINAGTNFAKIYVYLITSGYSIDDIAAFMVCPIAEFIDSRASSNMFDNLDAHNSAQSAINAALGEVNSFYFLHGSILQYNEQTEEYSNISKSKYIRSKLVKAISSNKQLEVAVAEALGADFSNGVSGSLNELMKGTILALTSDLRTLSLSEVIGSVKDVEINSYIRYCQDLIVQLRNVYSKYNKKMSELQADAREFKKIFSLASEMSSIASAYLGLNQGLPTDKLNLLKRLDRMRRTVTDRETSLGIFKSNLFKEGELSEKALREQQAARQKVIETLIDNNSTLTADEVWSGLENAYNAGIMNNFDVIKMLTDPEYKQTVKDYLHIIKGTVNVIDMMDKIPHYTEIMKCLRALVLADRSLSAKSRLIAELVQDGAPTEKQLQGVIRYVDRLNVADFLDTCPILETKEAVTGFNRFFDVERVNSFDFSKQEGVIGFKHFMETDFLSYLRSNYGDNPLVKHFQNITVDGRTNLSVDIDLLNPEVTTASKLAYDDILRGIAEFETVRYNDDYTITDMLQLYNIIVNGNQYGGERLTTAFKVCSDKNSILERFFKFTSDRDYDSDFIADSNLLDYQINAAPLISPSVERFHREPFIKVKDPVWDYIIKKYDKDTNSYTEYSVLPSMIDNTESMDTQNQRRINFIENCPFELPNRFKTLSDIRAIDFQGPFNEDAATELRAVLQNMSMSGKILIVKKC